MKMNPFKTIIVEEQLWYDLTYSLGNEGGSISFPMVFVPKIR